MLRRVLLSSLLILGHGLHARGSPEADVLPRRTGAAVESYPGIIVRYDTVRDAAGHRLRLITTHPRTADRVALIFVVGWLSCDSVEAPAGTMDASGQVFRMLARTPGFALVRLDKAGVGDSEGDCARTDFATELADYRAAFQRALAYDFVDPARVFLFGISNGGGFAPLVAEGAPVRGYVVDGGWIKTWFEHMLEIERRRLALAGRTAGELNGAMKSVEALYSAYLLEGRTPRAIFEAHPELKPLWEGSDPDHQYGRPVVYYQQLQQLDLMAAWAGVNVPVLALHGEFDWIMSRPDIELIAELVNRNTPGAAQFLDLPHTGHTFENYGSLADAFAFRPAPFDEAVGRRITEWFVQHR